VHEIKESDWKLLRELTPVAIARLCKRILAEVSRTCAPESEPYHDRFCKAHSIMESGNYELGIAFDNLRRSNALLRLTIMKGRGLITDEEFAKFSEETQQRVSVGIEA
jgi:hypothetical protein